MERRFGRRGPEVPVVGQGTWHMENERAAAVAALQHGLDRGLRHIDTAEMYGDGAVERLVGEAIAGRREEVFLVSKVLPYNASRQGTVRACEGSLERLGTDYLDCYLLHWPGSHPLGETIEAFEALVDSGKIRSYGVSNFDEHELAEAVALAGEGRIACNQLLYHLQERAIEHAALPRCRDLGVAMVAYSPFGSGEFPGASDSGGRVLAEIAANHGVSARQVALSFLLREPDVLVIPKASRIEHVDDNAEACTFSISNEEAAQLEAVFPMGPHRGGVPVL